MTLPRFSGRHGAFKKLTGTNTENYIQWWKTECFAENQITAKHHFLHMVNQVFLRVILSCEVKNTLLLKQKSTKTSIEVLSTTENKAPYHPHGAIIHFIYLTAN